MDPVFSPEKWKDGFWSLHQYFAVVDGKFQEDINLF